MCGRYTLTETPKDLQGAFDFKMGPHDIVWTPRYNIAPSQDVLAVINDGERQSAMLRWGLVPWFVKDLKKSHKPINARAEEVVEKSYFREAFKSRRCLVLADSYYEWRKSGKTRTPYRIGLQSWKPFAFAGLWESWRAKDSGEAEETGEKMHSCTIVTTIANELTGPIHDRMPVILSREAADIWLDGDAPSAELRELLVPYASGEMAAYEVSSSVNNWRNEDASCIEPVAKLL